MFSSEDEYVHPRPVKVDVIYKKKITTFTLIFATLLITHPRSTPRHKSAAYCTPS